jgi:hypothetical protein
LGTAATVEEARWLEDHGTDAGVLKGLMREAIAPFTQYHLIRGKRRPAERLSPVPTE